MNREKKTLEGRTCDKFGYARVIGEMRREEIKFTKRYDKGGEEYTFEIYKNQMSRDTYTGRWSGQKNKGLVECIVIEVPFNEQTTQIIELLVKGT